MRPRGWTPRGMRWGIYGGRRRDSPYRRRRTRQMPGIPGESFPSGGRACRAVHRRGFLSDGDSGQDAWRM